MRKFKSCRCSEPWYILSTFAELDFFLKRCLGPEYMFEVEDQFSGKRLSVCCTIVLCLETFYCECVLLPNDTIYLYTCFMINLTQHIVSFSMFPDHLEPNTVDRLHVW